MANPDYLFLRPDADRLRTLPIIDDEAGRGFAAAVKVAVQIPPARTVQEIEDGIDLIGTLTAGYLATVEALTADLHRGLDGLLRERGEPGWGLHFEDEVHAAVRRLLGDGDPDISDQPDSLRCRLQLVYDRAARKDAAA